MNEAATFITEFFDLLDAKLLDFVELIYRALAAEIVPFFKLLAVLLIIITCMSYWLSLGHADSRLLLVKVAVIPIILISVAKSWPTFEPIYLGITEGTDELIKTVTSGRSIWEDFGELYELMMIASDNMYALGGWGASFLWWIYGLWYSATAGVLIVTATGVMALSKVAIALLLSLSPLFIIAAMFNATRGVFSMWVGHVMGWALASVLVSLAVKLVFALLEATVFELAKGGLSYTMRLIGVQITILWVAWTFISATPFIAASITSGFGLQLRAGLGTGIMGGARTAGSLAGRGWNSVRNRMSSQRRTIRQR